VTTELTAHYEGTPVIDDALRARAAKVIPGGMYGHMATKGLPAGYPQFYARSEGCRAWDVDGHSYIDFMCSFGPIILGYGHPGVERAAAEQRAQGDTQPGPSPRLVELAELLVDRVEHADWAMFAKNGSDANTIAVTIARAVSGRHKVLAAAGAYHGSAPWSTPVLTGVTPADRASVAYFRFNDIESVRAAVDDAGGDVAAVLISPFKHDAGFDAELVDPEFARQLRALCDRIGAALILDEVRAGFRIAHGGSWEAIGVAPDLSAWSKAMANGYPIAAVLGGAGYAEGASSIYVTGSFWYQAVPMAAAIATITTLGDVDGVARIVRTGTRLREGLAAAARAAGVGIRQTGPVQMPTLTFEGDHNYARSNLFCSTAVRQGVIFHPRHNWFLSVAHGDEDIDAAVEAAGAGFEAVSQQFGGS
jgi:glutamate-1-semialdehyde 2,1-aminomutase